MKTIITTLEDSPNYQQDVIELIEEAFSYHSPFKVKEDFAPLFTHTKRKNYLLLSGNNEVIGHIGCLKKSMIFKNHEFPVNLIGGVALRKEYRGKGLFRPFMEHVLELEKKDCTFYLLWSDLTQLYADFDFTEVGIQCDTSTKEFELTTVEGHISRAPWPNISQQLLTTLKQIHQDFFSRKNLLYLKRDQDDWHSFRNISSTELFLYQPDKNLDIQGYFFKNKGYDLQTIIHDIACLKNYEESFFNLLKQYKSWVPFGTSEIIDNRNNYQKLFCCHIKIADPYYFKKYVNSIYGNSLKIKSIDLEKKQVQIEYHHQDYMFSTSELLRELFGPYPNEKSDLYRPLYIGGLESV